MSRKSLSELYKRGLISKDEFERAESINNVYRNYPIKEFKIEKKGKRDKNQKETIEFDVDNTFEQVLENEFEEFKQEMLKKTKEEIFESAYEITSKEEIKDNLKYMNLHRAEKEMLILQDDILTEFYHDWLDDDTPLGDSMKPCIEESIAVLTKYIGKRFNLKRKENYENER